ncbi:beta-glucosidase 6 [Calycina marina]|uniref:glucan 1,3-beta-glucosidase n=1 Tax=Calycina marina TaxID=1763456 RepID=A0A9P7ZAC5_9HELO|nr:beta-glucosidase 6 [Calycina marina]
MSARESPRPKPRERSHRHESRKHGSSPRKHRSHATSEFSSQALSADSLAKLNQLNQFSSRQEDIRPKRTRRKQNRDVVDEKIIVERSPRQHKRKKRRVVSGAILEEGNSRALRGIRGGAGYEKEAYDDNSDNDAVGGRKKKILIGIGIFILLLAIIIPVAVVVSKKQITTSSSTGSVVGAAGTASTSDIDGLSADSVPTAEKGTDLDPWSWYDTTDFNVTYTAETVGGLPIMGLNSTWDDSKSANANTVPISTAWGSYVTNPARGVNLGGWLSLEPFITPSLFNYDSKLEILDEWTLTTHLGTSTAKSTLEQHYATFVTEQTFIDIAAAGLDHVRIPFSYWTVATYTGDPYVARVSWRYLLRGIEWARKHGLRINLDVHGLPGSQNGWNHSGRQGSIGWLSGDDGTMNANRSLVLHDQLSQFFAQDRYKNIVAFYGLANEPKMTELDSDEVDAWTEEAFTLVRTNGITANIVFGDGFLGLDNWQGKLQGFDGLVLDVHQYVIFNTDQIVYNHSAKVSYACTGWTEQAVDSMSTTTGYGPTMFAEWSQADTDCATNLNNVGIGNRWTGTYDFGNATDQILTPRCNTQDSTCECTDANADASEYSSEYKSFLLMFAEAQMHSFEQGWGWFYWTWKTESAAQWSYELGLAAGILPAKAYSRDFYCNTTIPTFSGLPEYY